MTLPLPSSIRTPIQVLVVDDEAHVRDAYRQVLGAAPAAAVDGAALADVRARLFGRRESVPSAPPQAFELAFAAGAEEAVAAVAAARDAGRPFAVAFLDMRMPPGPDGAWAAERIRALDPDVEIVICTAYSDVDPADLGRRVPPDDKLFYLQKPFHPHEVRQLATALGRKWAAERHVLRLAYYDGLTGLPNRTYFQQQLAAAIAAADGPRHRLALLYLDLDNFKRINDTLGHGVGDELLRRMSDRLREIVRAHDLVVRPTVPESSHTGLARLGGDEFVVLLQAVADAEGALAAADRVVQALLQPLQLSAHQVLVTPSVGVALYPDHGTDVDTLFRNADLAMYFAKRRGPGEVALFDETMSSGGLRRLTLETKLREALAGGEFTLQYQPQFELTSANVVGLEALLRWTSPELGPISPADFIPIAEETGMIVEIGEWVLRTACAQLKAWLDAGLPSAYVSVNVSGLQFTRPGFTALVQRILQETGLPPQHLELEITESQFMNDEVWAERVVAELKRAGVSVAIDDFGTGYSSLSRLRQFAVDRLKIDRSFVREMHRSEEDRAFVSAMIRMAQTLGLGVVAEGVEQFDHLLLLQEDACDAAQGFLFGRPLPPAEAEAFLRRVAESLDTGRTQRFRQLAR